MQYLSQFRPVDEATTEAQAFLMARGYVFGADFTEATAVEIAGWVAFREGHIGRTER